MMGGVAAARRQEMSILGATMGVERDSVGASVAKGVVSSAGNTQTRTGGSIARVDASGNRRRLRHAALDRNRKRR